MDQGRTPLCLFLSALHDAQNKAAGGGGKATEGSGNEAKTQSADEKLKKKLHLKTFFKEEGKMPSEGKNNGARLTITAEGKADGVQLEELQKQGSLARPVSSVRRATSLKR